MEWISVNDKLPLQVDIVPAIFQGIMIYAQHIQNKWYFIGPVCILQYAVVINLPNLMEEIQVSHWMPLPKPPKE